MKKIVIVGARHLGWQDGIEARDQTGSPEAKDQVLRILREAKLALGGEFYVVTLSADTGFGKAVRETVAREGIGFAEITLRSSDLIPKAERELLWLSRHAALIEIGDEFHVFTTAGFSHMRDLIERIQVSGKPLQVYGPRK